MSNQNNRTKIKICGITNLEDARFAAGALVDYLGFIFYDKSPRYVDPAQAGAIINWIEGPQKVGVFVNQPLDDVNRIAKETGIDLVQLHGSESPEYCGLVDKPVIKAIHITEDAVPYLLRQSVERYAEVADYILFDTKIKHLWGGTGETFDWNLVKDIAEEIPVFLSGGLNNSNVKEAIKTVSPAVVDISSSLEAEPGIKDFTKIETFMNEMRIIDGTD